MEYEPTTKTAEKDSESCGDTREPSEEYERETVTIINKYGLHARPITMVVQLAMKYNLEIYIGNNKRIKGDISIDDKPYISAKSILKLLELEAKKGDKLNIAIKKGKNSKEAKNSLVDLIKSGFGED